MYPNPIKVTPSYGNSFTLSFLVRSNCWPQGTVEIPLKPSCSQLIPLIPFGGSSGHAIDIWYMIPKPFCSIILEPCPSKVYQQLMRRLCLEDEQLSNDFLNGVLNQLNWAFSEFVGILQEVRMLSLHFHHCWRTLVLRPGIQHVSIQQKLTAVMRLNHQTSLLRPSNINLIRRFSCYST